MRIAIDGRSLAVCKVPRGWDRYTLAVARELAAAGHDVVFIHRRGSVVEDSLLSRSGLAALAPADHGGIHWEQIALQAALARWNADVYLATIEHGVPMWAPCPVVLTLHRDRKSTRLNSSHMSISYAVFCLKKKKKE